jgi:hypothetical protein
VDTPGAPTTTTSTPWFKRWLNIGPTEALQSGPSVKRWLQLRLEESGGIVVAEKGDVSEM